jgi:hypothetical protein
MMHGMGGGNVCMFGAGAYSQALEAAAMFETTVSAMLLLVP